jgi:hypothetical protein
MYNFRQLTLILLCLTFVPSIVFADPLKYKIEGETVTVVGCDKNASVELVIPATYEGKPVTSIGPGAFGQAFFLDSIKIPESIVNISNYAFGLNISLTRINVDENNPMFSSVDGVLFNKSVKKLVKFPKGRSGEYTVPFGVTHIGESAFAGCTNLEEVNFPKSVVSIGLASFSVSGLKRLELPDNLGNIEPYAFDRCTNLEHVIIPFGVISIGNSAFSNCKKLKSIFIPDGAVKLGDWLFESCEGLTNIRLPSHITIIPSGAFTGCTQLSEVKLTSNLKSIGNSAFKNCVNSNYFDFGVELETIESSAFSGCINLKDVQLPDGIMRIGGESFFNCSDLKTIFIPKSLVNIGMRSFSGCNKLIGVNVDEQNPRYSSENGILFENNGQIIRYPPTSKGNYTIPLTVSYIREDAFSDCIYLKVITIHGGVRGIGHKAFSNCVNLERVVLFDGIKSLSKEAFFGCTKLEEIRIPKSLNYIEESVFSGCENLRTIVVDEDNTSFCSLDGVLFNKNKTVLIKFPGGKIGDYIIPESVIWIKPWAFRKCGNLKRVVLNESITNIGKQAFFGCSNLERIIIPDNVVEIESFAFSECSNLHSVIFSKPANNADKAEYKIIGEGAFSKCSKLKTLKIPDNVTNILNGAFSYCSSLTSIVVEEGNENYYSENGVLFTKSKTILSQYPAGKSGAYVIPEGVRIINDAFTGSGKLTSLTIPKGITYISESTSVRFKTPVNRAHY